MTSEISMHSPVKIQGKVISALLSDVKSSIFKLKILCKYLNVLVMSYWQHVAVSFTEFLDISQW